MPMPAEPKLYLSGSRRMSAVSSCMFFAGTFGLTTSTVRKRAVSEMGELAQHAFISYDEKDARRANVVQAALEAAGIRVSPSPARLGRTLAELMRP